MKSKLIIILMVLSVSAFGQNHFIGIKGGVNWANVSPSNSIANKDKLVGLAAGLSYTYHLKQHFTLGADLLYTQKGYSSYVIIFPSNPEEVKIEGAFNYDYISLPLKAGLIYGEKISGFANIGIIPSFLVNAKSVLSTSSNNETYDVTDIVTRFDFAGLIDIGASLNINKRAMLYTSFEYQHSFTTITNSEYRADDKIKHYGVTLSFGLRYALTNN